MIFQCFYNFNSSLTKKNLACIETNLLRQLFHPNFLQIVYAGMVLGGYSMEWEGF